MANAETPKLNWADVPEDAPAESSEESGEQYKKLMESQAQAAIVDDEESDTSYIVQVFQAGGADSQIFCQEHFHQFNLSEQLLDSVFAQGWTKPTIVQSLFLHKILGKERRDLIVVAPTGSGKTSGFVICMLHRVNIANNYPQVVCVSPTMELAEMTYVWLTKMGVTLSGLRIAKLTRPDGRGGMDYQAMATEFKDSHVIVCTPMTLIKVSEWYRDLLSRVNLFVLDEADMLLENKEMTVQVNKIKSLISGQTGRARMQARGFQTLMFSATFTEEDFKLSKKFTTEPSVVICPGIPRATAHVFLDMAGDPAAPRSIQDEAKLVEKLHSTWSGAQTMVFVETQRDCQAICDSLKASMGERVQYLHSKVENRREVFDLFTKGTIKLLICTRLASRGLDIPTVSLVILRDIPRYFETKVEDPISYLHMVGRTGRIGNVGVAVTFAKTEAERKSIIAIQNSIRRMVSEAVEKATKPQDLAQSAPSAPAPSTPAQLTIHPAKIADIEPIGQQISQQRQKATAAASGSAK